MFDFVEDMFRSFDSTNFKNKKKILRATIYLKLLLFLYQTYIFGENFMKHMTIIDC